MTERITETPPNDLQDATDEQVSPWNRLSDKQIAFVREFAKAPWNKANAERKAGYASSAAQRLLKDERILAAITDEIRRLEAAQTSREDVSAWILSKMRDPTTPAMAGARLAELLADLHGWRQPASAPAEVRATSAVFLAQAPALDRANDIIRELSAALPDKGGNQGKI